MSQSAIDSPSSAGAGLSSSQSLAMQSPFIESPPVLKPPVSFVFVGKPKPMARSTIQATTSPLKSPNPRLNASFDSTTATMSGTYTSVGGFRLQPRQMFRSTPSPQGIIDSSRGRKRRVGSLNDSGTSPDRELTCSPAAHLKRENPIFEFSSQWRTPSKTGTPEGSTDSPDGNALDLQGLSLRSPLPPSPPRPPKGKEGKEAESQKSLIFSSFSRFSHSPESSSLRRNVNSSTDGTEESMSTEGVRSPSLNSVKSSPKIIPVKVLLHNDPKAPLSSRPPLHDTPVSAQNHSEEDEKPFAGALLPPEIFMATGSPHGRLSTIQDPDAINPPPKQRRTEHFDSPSSHRSTPGRSPRTPKISLTPRSDRLSSYKHSEDFPLFPSPPQGLSTYDEERNESHMILKRAYERNMTIGSPERSSADASRPESFIPLPDWGEPQTTSWLRPSGTDEFAGIFPDNDSLSDDSDNTGFVLASPAVIAEENVANVNAKQRRLQPVADSTGHLSSTSLVGVNFIASNNCLAAMESQPAGMSLSSLSRLPASNGQLHRNESQTSVGLTLEHEPSNSQSTERDLTTPPSLPQPKDPPRLSQHG